MLRQTPDGNSGQRTFSDQSVCAQAHIALLPSLEIKRREGSAGGGRSASPRKASHEWCPQDYSISLLSLESVYKCAQYSCSTHVGCKLKQKQGRSASPRKASHGHDRFIRNVGGPYHPPLWRCHSIQR